MAGTVIGLRSDGDGFLAVRSRPGAQHRRIGQLHNADCVTIFGGQGDWLEVKVPDGQSIRPMPAGAPDPRGSCPAPVSGGCMANGSGASSPDQRYAVSRPGLACCPTPAAPIPAGSR
ncbi:SH3 domain-containing protein [Paracoccus sp. MC1862]|nr:SH3 domain-containing protein [Paracoccus sp. MC1862]